MLVEEAGQVLEAHILGALVPSIKHVILIGDPQQLRPTINNYGERLTSSGSDYRGSFLSQLYLQSTRAEARSTSSTGH